MSSKVYLNNHEFEDISQKEFEKRRRNSNVYYFFSDMESVWGLVTKEEMLFLWRNGVIEDHHAVPYFNSSEPIKNESIRSFLHNVTQQVKCEKLHLMTKSFDQMHDEFCKAEKATKASRSFLFFRTPLFFDNSDLLHYFGHQHQYDKPPRLPYPVNGTLLQIKDVIFLLSVGHIFFRDMGVDSLIPYNRDPTNLLIPPIKDFYSIDSGCDNSIIRIDVKGKKYPIPDVGSPL